MTSALERVARALCELDANPADATMDGKPLWQDYLLEARAAIMALSKPDRAMISAGAHEGAPIGNADIEKIYRVMIETALIEKPTASGHRGGETRDITEKASPDSARNFKVRSFHNI